MNSISPELMLSMLLSTSLKKIIVPTEFHSQAQAVKEIMRNDSTGLVDSLTDFSVNTANVNFTLDTTNDNLNKTLNKWLEKINIEYLGQVPPGMKALAKEYFIERWKGSSFPILKIVKWGKIDGIMLPTKMFFIDGGSVYAEDRNKKEDNLKLLNYDYYIGRDKKNREKLNPNLQNVLITKPYGRWFDNYPLNFIVKRGIYHNWRLIQLLKDNQSQVLSQIIPYMMLIKKGSENLAEKSIKTYDNVDLKGVIESIENMVQTFNDSSAGTKANKSMIRATQFDETIDHLIPDLGTIFKEELFSGLERNILS